MEIKKEATEQYKFSFSGDEFGGKKYDFILIATSEKEAKEILYTDLALLMQQVGKSLDEKRIGKVRNDQTNLA